MLNLLRNLLAISCLTLAASAAASELRGHGGPVRAIAVIDSGAAVSGGFDQSAILWDLGRGAARAVLRGHEGAVNAAVALGADRFATGGEDGRIAVWRGGTASPDIVTAAHTGPVAGLALSPDRRQLASASWDGTIRIGPPEGGDAARVLTGHAGPVNAVAWLRDGRLASAGYDGTVRFWPPDGSAPALVTLSGPVNALAATAAGEVAAGGADGVVRLIATDGTVRETVDLSAGPILALAASPDGREVAASTVGRAVAIMDLGAAVVRRRLFVPGGPVWALAFGPDGSELFSGGSDGIVRRWNAGTGEPSGPAAVSAATALGLAAIAPTPAGTERGAEVFRACVACHTLARDGGNRAGPSLHGIFGRRIATAPGYAFSPALKGLDIVWTAETISRLFEIGPARYTPGTKMPEQTVTAADRRELVRFLEAATAPER